MCVCVCLTNALGSFMSRIRDASSEFIGQNEGREKNTWISHA